MHAGKVTPAMRIYNAKEWKTCRKQAMMRAEYVCQHPGCSERLDAPGSCHVHHRKPLKKSWALAYEALNHQALCVSHHSAETNREIAEARGKLKPGCDIDGRPLDPRHPWFGK
jgi:5-methylcytosine-specific restriction endonuclease McrA